MAFQGKRLKQLRSKKGYTMEDLAKLVTTTKGTISNYENGHSSPPNEMIVALADVLSTSADYLLGITDDPEQKSRQAIITHKQGSGKSGLTLAQLKEELKRNNIDIFAHGGFEGFEDLSAEEQQFILQNVKNSIEMFKKMKEQNK